MKGLRSIFLMCVCAAASGFVGSAGARPAHTEETREPQASLEPPSGARNSGGISAPGLQTSYGKLPLSFEANWGQVDERVKFLSRTRGYTLFLTSVGAVLVLQRSEEKSDRGGQQFRPEADQPPAEKGKAGKAETIPTAMMMRFLGANRGPKVTGLEELSGKSNYFTGNDPKKWRTNIPTYRKVKYERVYPGIDLVYYGNGRQLEFDFIVGPGADPELIRLELEGADRVEATPTGDLDVHIKTEKIRLQRPSIYQELAGAKKEIPGSYRLKSKRQVGFQLASYDKDKPLIIDPVLEYSSYLGGAARDESRGIAVDGQGNVYVTGTTTSTDFPTTNALQPAYAGATDFPISNVSLGTLVGAGDVFVTKIDSNGSTLIYSTYLGGGGNEIGLGIAVDSLGSAYITGTTSSGDFPTTHTFQPAFRAATCSNPDGSTYSCPDGFVSKLTPAGSGLIYSTYLGGTGWDDSRGIAIDSSGHAFVAGYTASSDFPTVNALQSARAAGMCGFWVCFDGFVTKLSPHGSALVYSTYLGGSGGDEARGIAVDREGHAYIAGTTSSSDFPTVNALQLSYAGNGDVFVAKLNKTGSALSYSTYLGGSAWDESPAISVGSSGNAHVTGWTQSSDFPTANAFQPTIASPQDAFISKLDATGSALLYSTYLGGNFAEQSGGIATDVDGNTYITGGTDSTDFPSVNAFQPSKGGSTDVFVTKVNPAGSIVYSSFVGGSQTDFGAGIAVDTAGNAYVTGSTTSSDFPTVNAFQSASAGSPDVFVAKILGTTASSGPSVKNVIWANPINVTVTGNSLQKTSGCDGCADAGAVSQQQISSGDGYVEFTASETTTLRAIGLSNGNPATSCGELDFAIGLWPGGGFDIRENGLYRNDSIFTAGDVFRIAVELGVVKYYRNGILLYTSTIAPTYPLVVDTSLLSLNATVSNAVIRLP